VFSDFYHCEMWDLSDDAVDNIYVAWHMGMRPDIRLYSLYSFMFGCSSLWHLFHMNVLLLLIGILSSDVIVMVSHYTVFMQSAKSLLGHCFIVISETDLL